MTASIDSLVKEVQETGSVSGLPDKHFIAGSFRALGNEALDCFDPGTAKPFARFAAGATACRRSAAVSSARRPS